MPQLTVRLDEDLARQVKTYAGALGRSVNSWVVALLRAATDPDLADSETERTRARLARAGLLLTPKAKTVQRPDQARIRRARRTAGKGTPLSKLVSDGRG